MQQLVRCCVQSLILHPAHSGIPTGVPSAGGEAESEDSPEQRLQAQGDVDCNTLGFGSSVLS